MDGGVLSDQTTFMYALGRGDLVGRYLSTTRYHHIDIAATQLALTSAPQRVTRTVGTDRQTHPKGPTSPPSGSPLSSL